MYPTPVKSLFENTMGNPFFWLFEILTETLQKKIYNRNMDILISNLLSESIFDVGKWSNWKYANTRICVFSVWLPEVENWFRKQICNKNVHISILNFFFEEFRSLFWKVQKWISHCIFKKWFDRGRVHFLAEKFLKKPNFPKYA